MKLSAQLIQKVISKTFPGTVAWAARSTLGVGHFFTWQKENIKAAGKGRGGRFF
jgi:hypothetical protein